ncbi:RHS repeat-associated protein [Natronospira proteinivora]|uniref:RHS repeat-associated protein n=1 Tax=Natronospira proteinivora TaxID=1807133 RepID=A0ABT1GCQ4_9GAMM|nr:RHS repeat-associated protein [Natronospira proteinivora]
MRTYAEATLEYEGAFEYQLAVGEELSLDGSNSHHVDGEIVSYEWREIDSDKVLGESESLETSFQAPGEYRLQFTIWDQHGLGQSLDQPVEVAVYSEPTFEITGPKAAWIGETIHLSIEFLEDQLGEVEFQWMNSHSGEVVGDSAEFLVSPTSAGEFHYEVTVRNERGLEASESIVLSFLNPPMVNIGGATEIHVGDDLELEADASESEHDIVSYQWIDPETGEVLGESGTLSLAGLAQGQHQLLLRMTDANGLEYEQLVDVDVQPPRPVIVLEEAVTVAQGAPVTLDANESHVPDGEIESFQWFHDGEVVGQDPVLALDDLPLGEWVYELVVTSVAGVSASQTVTVDVVHQPTAEIRGDLFVYEGREAVLDASESHIPEGELSYQWLLDGEPVGSESELHLADLAPGEYAIELTVTSAADMQDTAEATLVVQAGRGLSACPYNPVEDDRDRLPTHPDGNIDWQGGQAETVEAITQAFNYARAQDDSVFQYLVMPDQADWDAMSVSEKGLYLVNAERMARGLKPFSGFDPAVVTAAQEFADYTRDNVLMIDHFADGRSPQERMDAVPYIDEHRHNQPIDPESLAYGLDSEIPSEDYAVARAIYQWIYEDADWFEEFEGADGPAWGHRDHVFQVGLADSSHDPHQQGVLGFGLSRGDYPLDGVNDYGYVTVLKTVNQGESWDAERIQSVDTRQAQGCNTDHVIHVDPQHVDVDSLTGLRIEPNTLFMALGDSHAIQVTGLMDNGGEVDLSPYAQFTPDSRSIVSVDNGRISAERVGHARVLARLEGMRSNRLHVRVREAADTDQLVGTPAESLRRHVAGNATVERYEPMAMAVYTGLVTDRDGDPLPGVQVSFLNEPEHGSMETDADGRFMITGSAGERTVVYEYPGHLVIQRTTIGASGSWAVLDEVMMLPRDTAVSRIELGTGEAQVHQSSLISDEFGERRATVIFNGIQSATAMSLDGSEREITAFDFSATEYETPASMPGELPKEVAFTFANDLHVAGTHHTETVVFDNDVVMYIDNFLDFEVGEIVPIGYFDRLDNQWVGSDNGVVVQLVDESGDGLVDGADYTGDGQANDLNGSGYTHDDVIGLAEHYEPGDTLWWGHFDHMTPWDYNWAPDDAEAPSELGVDKNPEDACNSEAASTGSFARPFQQSFHEDLEVAGTNLTLHYSSRRTQGYQHEFRVTVSGDEVPDSMERMVAQLEIGGHVFKKELSPAPNREVRFLWDGENIDGERTEGMVHGQVKIGYEYPTVYMSAGNAAESEQAPDEFPMAWATLGERATEVPGREAFMSWQSRGVSVKNSFDRQLADGWSLSNVHEYDPAGTVYRGDGRVQDVADESVILKTGQTRSLVEGDDGYYQRGGNTINYRINSEGILEDRITGLEWEYAENPHQVITLPGAEAWCEVYADLPGDGWRLPTAKEIAYGMDKGGANPGPAIYNVRQARQLWHQSTANPELNMLPVLCVRGEALDERQPESLASNVVEQVVVDQDNGLMWEDRHANAAQKMDWESSVAHCEASEHAGYDNWRLPNINELLYALPNEVFRHQTEWDESARGRLWDYDVDFRRPYWSATTNHSDDDRAWAIESASYNSERFKKEDEFYVRCVRDDHSAQRMPYRFDGDGRHRATIDMDSGKTLTEFEYDAEDRLIAAVDRFGNRVRIERDANGIVERIVAPDGQETRLTVDDDHHLAAVTYEDGAQYRFNYTACGLATDKIDPRGGNFSRAYDEHGRIIETGDPEGGSWSFFDDRLDIGHDHYGYTTAEGNAYETERRVLDDGAVETVTTHKNGTVTTSLLSADGLESTSETCDISRVVESRRDPKTRQPRPERITLTQPSGLRRVMEMDLSYAENGADTSRYTVVSGRDGRLSSMSVDARSGQISHQSPEGRGFTQQLDTDTLLPESLQVEGLPETRYAYDSRGRLLEEVTGDRRVAYSYDERGRVATVTTPDDRNTAYEYDERDRITRIIFPDGQSLENRYDAKGNRTTLVVPTPAEHEFDYTGVNRVSAYRTPLDEATHYEYDRDRRLTAVTLPSGQRMEHSYADGRHVSTSTPEGVIEYDYLCGGRVSQITEGSESLSYDWDGNLVTGVHYQGALNASLSYGYNTDFELDQMSYAGGQTSLSYDKDGLLTGIHGFDIDRDAKHGMVTGLSDGVLNSSWQYNDYAESVDVTQSVAGTQFDYELERNSLGRITARTETLPDGSEVHYEYRYDDRQRLTEVIKNGQTVEQYQYDANGNRVQTTSTARDVTNETAQYNLADQLQSRQTTDGEVSYEYDGNGRLSKKHHAYGQVTEYNYDSQGRLKSVTTPEHHVEYQHNALGNRVSKSVDGEVVEYYLWQDKTTLLATYDGDGNLKQRFEYTVGHTPSRFTQDGETYYILASHLGSPRAIVDESGEVLREIQYDAYGSVIEDSNPEFSIPFGFAGGLTDEHTGLIRFGYRDYDPRIGRWTARDPVGFAGGDPNLYGYVLGDPVNLLDSLGLRGEFYDSRRGRRGIFAQAFMPAHTAQFSRDPIGGAPEAQLAYSANTNQIRGASATAGYAAVSGPLVGKIGVGTTRYACATAARHRDQLMDIVDLLLELSTLLTGEVPADMSTRGRTDAMGIYHQQEVESRAPRRGPRRP